MTLPSFEDVLSFWFEEIQPEKWWKKDEAFDLVVRERFLPLWEAAGRGELDAWQRTARGSLALVIVLDQFPRNMFRGEGMAFSTDAQARDVTVDALRNGMDQQLPQDEQRIFLYLPLEHSESLPDQELMCRLAKERLRGKGAAEFLKFAEAHLDVIQRFGRFPHRNSALGRVSTPEEEAYLATPGAGF